MTVTSTIYPIISIPLEQPSLILEKALPPQTLYIFIERNKELIGYLSLHSLQNCLHEEQPSFLIEKEMHLLDRDAYILEDGQIHHPVRLFGHEVVIVRNDAHEVMGFLYREDFMVELIRQDDPSLTFLKSILTSIPLGVLLFDLQGVLIKANSAALKMLQLTTNPTKQHISTLLPNLQYEEVLTSHTMRLNHIYSLENMTFLVDLNPIFQRDDTVTGFAVVLQDLPSVQHIVHELDDIKNLNTDLNAILSTVYDEILVVDAKGILLRFSHSTIPDLWTTPLASLVGKNLLKETTTPTVLSSLLSLVFERKRKTSLLQETALGKNVMIVGNPVFNNDNQLDRIIIASRDITETSQLKSQFRAVKKLSEQYRQELESLKGLAHKVVYRSGRMEEVMRKVKRVASFSSTILITGESGVGKEVIAKAIHHLSPRHEEPYLKVNCGAIPEHLLESELFGYERGAFTGADSRGKKGYFQQAHKGVLFLDEIGELPLSLQVKLLRVLQEREVTPVGSTKSHYVDVHIITATNCNLEKLVEEGKFREDLYYRLHVIPIELPPLRERIDDIEVLAFHFLHRLNEQFQQQKTLSMDAVSLLESYSWPGNVRELQNVMERIVVTTEEDVVTAATLHQFLNWNKSTVKTKPIVTSLLPLKEATEHVEEQLILLAMEKYKTTTAAAKALGISQASVSRKYQKLVEKQQLQLHK